jgi:uncharacterized protein YjbJ (UPF0337 family)
MENQVWARQPAGNADENTFGTHQEVTMGKNLDEAKGRVKEAAGDLADDDDLQRDGALDRVGAAVKDKADDAAEKVGDAVDSVKDSLRPSD